MYFFLFSFYPRISKYHHVTLVVMKHYFYLSHVRMPMYDCRKMYMEKLSRNSFLGFYGTYCYSMLVHTGVITSSLTSFYSLPVYSRHLSISVNGITISGSQTSNREFILDTFLSLTLSPPSPPHQFISRSSSFYLVNISQICLLLHFSPPF